MEGKAKAPQPQPGTRGPKGGRTMNWGKIVNGVALIGAMLFCLLMLGGLVFFCIDHHRIGEIEKQVRENKPQIEWLVKTQNKQR